MDTSIATLPTFSVTTWHVEPRNPDGWRHRAACDGPQATLFFPPEGVEPREQRLDRERAAKALCAACPVRPACREYALDVREPYGIWGGLNEYERRRLARTDRQAS